MVPLHIRCGDDILDTLRTAGLEGDRTRWSDPVCEGPLHPWPTDQERRRERAVFLVMRYFLSYGEVYPSLAMEDHAVDDADKYGETVLWFEHDLFDQASLVFLLVRLAPLMERRTLSLICIGEHPRVSRFVGLGQLDAADLAELYPTRRPVTMEQVALARRAWAALQAPTPSALWALTQEDTSALPFLREALLRYLAQYPSLDNGLSRTERWGLEGLAAGARTAKDAFAVVQAREPRPFQGDSMFYATLRELATGPQPLISAGVPRLPKLRDNRFSDLELELTPTAADVLQGRADWFRVNGASRWIGGTHLIGPEPAWRWDEADKRLVEAGR